MAKLSILAGATGQSVNIFVQDISKTTGAGLTGLVFNSPNLIAYYTFAGANATATSITLATLASVNSAYSSGGFKEIDAVHMAGAYRFDIPNAALAAASGRSVLIMLSGAANMAPVLLEIELTAVDNQSSTYGLNGAISLTESYSSLHSVPTLSQILFEIRALLAENSVSGTTVTTKKIDGSTTAETFTLDSSTAPTTITRAS